MYQTEIINEVKTLNNPKFNWNTAKKWLDFYVKYGLVSKERRGKWVLYTIDRTNPVVKEFKIFINVTKLYDVIRSLSIKNAEIYLFGSAARGEDSENSDIDLLIIGQIDDNTLVDFKDAVREKMKKEVNPIVYSRAQYSDLYRSDRVFFENIDKDKIKLF